MKNYGSSLWYNHSVEGNVALAIPKRKIPFGQLVFTGTLLDLLTNRAHDDLGKYLGKGNSDNQPRNSDRSSVKSMYMHPGDGGG